MAAVGTLWMGFMAYPIHDVAAEEEKENVMRRWARKRFNAAGAAAGWLAAWVVIVRWLGCPGLVCADEPRATTVLLAAFAFVGVSGFLRLTLAHGFNAVAAAINKAFGK